MSIYRHACQDSFQLHAIFRSIWRNVDGQLSFFRYSVSAPPEIFTFAHYAWKLAFANELSAKEVPNALANHAWLSLVLLEILCQLAKRDHAETVQQILELPLKRCPEFLLPGIAQIYVFTSQLYFFQPCGKSLVSDEFMFCPYADDL